MTPEQRKKFFEERAHAIGGSDVRHLIGVEGGCERMLHYDKTGVKKDFPFQGNKHTERGTEMEPIIARIYCRDKKYVQSLAEWTPHPDIPTMGSHLDRILYRSKKDASERADPGVMEIKCPSAHIYYKLKAEGPSLASQLQLQWGLACSGYRWGVIVAFNADAWDYKAWEYPRDETMIEDLKKLCLRHSSTWNQPNSFDRLDPNSASCHKCEWRKTCQGIGHTWIPPEDLPDPKEPDVEDESLFDVVSDYVAAQKRCKEAESLLKTAKDALIDRLSGPTRARCSLGRVVYVQQERKAHTVKATSFMALRVVPFKKDLIDGEIE